jgi:hypothetical protein
MLKSGHPIEPEELMAYLDGELEIARSQVAAEHLERCAECREAAEDFRRVSRAMSAWEVEECRAVAPGGKVRRPWRWWKAAVAGAMAVMVLAVVGVRRTPLRDMALTGPMGVVPGSNLVAPQYEVVDTSGKVVSVKPTLRAEGYDEATGDVTLRLIARTTQLEIATKNVGRARIEMEAVVNRHHGYVAQFSAHTDRGTPSELTAQLQIPTPELSASLGELRQIVRVVAESQTAEDVTRQSTDLDARLANERIMEQRLKELLRQRTGRLSEVLEVEQQISRVRGEIERMETERKALTHRVEYVSVALKLSETDATPGGSLGAAARDRWRKLLGELSGAAKLMLAFGPSMILWGGLLFFPARLAWRRWKRRA